MTNLEKLRSKEPVTRYASPIGQIMRDFDGFFRDFDRLMHPLKEPMGSLTQEWEAGFELKETDKAYLMSFDLPGVKKENINLEIAGDRLTISAERKAEEEVKDSTYYFTRKSYGKFEKSFRLPDDVNKDNIEGNFEDGVLELFVPKAQVTESKKISIGENRSNFLKRLIGKKDETSKPKVANA